MNIYVIDSSVFIGNAVPKKRRIKSVYASKNMCIKHIPKVKYSDANIEENCNHGMNIVIISITNNTFDISINK